MADSTPTTVAVPSRRSMLKRLAVAGIAVPALAACSSSDSTDADKTSTTPADALTASADVPVGGGVILADANIVVTQPQKGTFEGFSATCTHKGCTLASVSNGTINCGCHGSQFSIEDGTPVQGPNGSPASTISPLPKRPVKVDGANIVTG